MKRISDNKFILLSALLCAGFFALLWGTGAVLSPQAFSPLNLLLLFLGAFLAILVAVFLFRQRFNRHLYRLAYADLLTGLANTNYFEEEGDRRRRAAAPHRLCVVSTDISHFSTVNDSYGRQMGDDIILRVSKALQEAFGEETLLARVKADHFLLLLPFSSEEETRAALLRFGAQNSDYSAASHHIKLRFNFGVSEIGDSQVPFTAFIDAAEIARREARIRPEPVLFFSGELEEQLRRNREMEDQMEQALADGEFVAYYQPKFNMATGEICGAEALVRWQRGPSHLYYPDQFIPLFERNGFITEVDFCVLDQTCALLRRRLDGGLPVFPISVNQSRLHLQEEGYLQRLTEMVKRHRVPPNLIELELTETAFNGLERLDELAKQLKKIGFLLSLDDFGSGYSSLSLLGGFPLDTIKLDRTFMDRALSSSRSQTIVQKVVELAHEMGILDICEGVELPEQARFLLQIGCQHAQGYLYARPIPADAFEALCRQNAPVVPAADR